MYTFADGPSHTVSEEFVIIYETSVTTVSDRSHDRHRGLTVGAHLAGASRIHCPSELN